MVSEPDIMTGMEIRQNNKQSKQHETRRFMTRRIVFRAAAICAVCAVIFLTACSDGSAVLTSPETHSQHSSVELRFTDSTANYWPPQPLNISNIKRLPVTPSSRPEESAKQTVQEQLSSVLGNNYAMLGSHKIENKQNDSSYVEIEFFIYDRNEVLIATLDPTNTDSLDYTISPASRYQPPESQQEVVLAIKLAAINLTEQGFTSHLDLIGTALLAYPSATEEAQDNSPFYPNRMLYVTFGPGAGQLPHYRALVNLSNNSVEQSGLMQ